MPAAQGLLQAAELQLAVDQEHRHSEERLILFQDRRRQRHRVHSRSRLPTEAHRVYLEP